ncbi:MAG: TOBE domain-containing protein, partial [Cyanobium sp.]
ATRGHGAQVFGPQPQLTAIVLGRPALNLLPPDDGRQLGLRPEHLRPVTTGGLPARLRRREWWGAQQLLWVETPRGELRVLMDAQQPIPETVQLGWNTADELWFDAGSGERIAPPPAFHGHRAAG